MVSLGMDKDILNKIKGYLESVTFINSYEIFEGLGCVVNKLNLVMDYKDRNVKMKFRSKKIDD